MESLGIILLSLIVWPIRQVRQLFFCGKCSTAKVEIRDRLPFFDLIKGVAIWAVIFIHVGHFYLYFPAGRKDLLFIDLTNNLTRFAIPLFLICSGILLNPLIGQKQIGNFYWRKIWRIFVPYLLCTAAYAFFYQQSLLEFFYNLISGQAEIPYYFMIVLLQLYLLYPLLNLFREKKYFLSVTFVISLVCYLVPELRYFYGVPLCFEFLFFFSYGLYCRNKFINYQPDKEGSYLWLFIVVFYLALILIRPEYYYNTQLFYGLAIFNLIFYFKQPIVANKFAANMLIRFGQNSLWVYLLHFPVVYWLYLLVNNLKLNYYLSFFLVFAVSLLTVYVMAIGVQLVYDGLLRQVFKYKFKRGYA